MGLISGFGKGPIAMNMATHRRPTRYRDVLAMLKQLARMPSVSDAGLRAVLAGNVGDAYTQQDVARTHELAQQLGWEVVVDLPDEQQTEFGSPEDYQAEIRRLHALVRAFRTEVAALRTSATIAHNWSAKIGAKRQAQLTATGAKSVDDAFAQLATLRAFVLTLTSEGAGSPGNTVCELLQDVQDRAKALILRIEGVA